MTQKQLYYMKHLQPCNETACLYEFEFKTELRQFSRFVQYLCIFLLLSFSYIKLSPSHL